MADTSIMFSFRLPVDIHEALKQIAREEGLEATAYVQLLIRKAVAVSGVLGEAESRRIAMMDGLILRAVEKAQALYTAGRFNEHFTLTVFRALTGDETFRRDYEDVIGGGAFETKLEGKFPLNMYLGWYIKNAVGADPLFGDDGKPRRATVRGEAIQSYTLLKEGTGRT